VLSSVRVQVSFPLSMIEKFVHFKDFEKQNLILKICFNNLILNKSKLKCLHRTNKNSSITLLRNSCIFTKRNRGIVKKYKISRLQFKRLATRIPGIRKSSF
jgi:small subunit ribosomal protein S14